MPETRLTVVPDSDDNPVAALMARSVELIANVTRAVDELTEHTAVLAAAVLAMSAAWPPDGSRE